MKKNHAIGLMGVLLVVLVSGCTTTPKTQSVNCTAVCNGQASQPPNTTCNCPAQSVHLLTNQSAPSCGENSNCTI